MGWLSDAVISAILKKGVIGEFNKFETLVEFPQESGKNITLKIKADKMEVTLFSGKQQEVELVEE